VRKTKATATLGWFRLAVASGLMLAAVQVRAQDTDGPFTQKEIEALRDSAYVPVDRLRTLERILDDREKEIERLEKAPHHADFNDDMHDLIDQFGQIVSEMNDNIDDYSAKRRDIRKELPKVARATERWSTTLRAAGEEDAYRVVRRIALDALTDMKTSAEEIQVEQETYFKAHPDAAKAEKARSEDPHSPR
jgi:septal ring factor EnvC (AmiA/AmiB activator)